MRPPKRIQSGSAKQIHSRSAKRIHLVGVETGHKGGPDRPSGSTRDRAMEPVVDGARGTEEGPGEGGLDRQMSARTTDMHRLQELVRLHRLGLTERRAAKELRIGRNTAKEYRRALSDAGVLDGSADELPTLEVLKAIVLRALPPRPAPQQRRHWSNSSLKIRRTGADAQSVAIAQKRPIVRPASASIRLAWLAARSRTALPAAAATIANRRAASQANVVAAPCWVKPALCRPTVLSVLAAPAAPPPTPVQLNASSRKVLPEDES